MNRLKRIKIFSLNPVLPLRSRIVSSKPLESAGKAQEPWAEERVIRDWPAAGLIPSQADECPVVGAAFPGHRAGKITVGYASKGAGWTLSVSDDGVGMPADQASARPGLGTSIIEALAKQLDATVAVASVDRGTSVSIVRV